MLKLELFLKLTYPSPNPLMAINELNSSYVELMALLCSASIYDIKRVIIIYDLFIYLLLENSGSPGTHSHSHTDSTRRSNGKLIHDADVNGDTTNEQSSC